MVASHMVGRPETRHARFVWTGIGEEGEPRPHLAVLENVFSVNRQTALVGRMDTVGWPQMLDQFPLTEGRKRVYLPLVLAHFDETWYWDDVEEWCAEHHFGSATFSDLVAFVCHPKFGDLLGRFPVYATGSLEREQFPGAHVVARKERLFPVWRTNPLEKECRFLLKPKT